MRNEVVIANVNVELVIVCLECNILFRFFKNILIRIREFTILNINKSIITIRMVAL